MSAVLDPNRLLQFSEFLSLAASPDTEIQKQVYAELSVLECHTETYPYLFYILGESTHPIGLRQLAGLTAHSALTRNRSTLKFSPQGLSYLKQQVFPNGTDTPMISRTKSKLLSVLVNLGSFDYELLGFLLHGSHLPAICVILEDLKMNSENYVIFQQPQFVQFMQLLLEAILRSLQPLRDLPPDCLPMKCFNLLIFHLPPCLDHLLSGYIQQIATPLLSQCTDIPTILQHFQSINQIVSTKCACVPTAFLHSLITYNPPAASLPILKCWANIFLEVVDRDEEEEQLDCMALLDRSISFLPFTAEDEQSVRESMEVDYNPAQSACMDDVQEDGQASQQSSREVPLRKLCCMLIEKICLKCEDVWGSLEPLLQRRMLHQDESINQTAVVVVGIIADISLETISPAVFSYIFQKAHSGSDPLLKATSMWAIEKSISLYSPPQLTQALSICLSNLAQYQSHPTTILMMVDASLSLLDQVLSQCHSKAVDVTTAPILTCLIHLMNELTSSRLLCSTLKAVVSYFKYGCVSQKQVDTAIVQLCLKWTHCIHHQPIMCSLIQCITEIYDNPTSTYGLYLQTYSPQIFQQLLQLLAESKHKGQEQLILRVITLISTLVGTKHPTILSNLPSIHCLLVQLLHDQSNQIKRFTYGMINDLSQYLPTPFFIAAIHPLMDFTDIPILNNALQALTTLLLRTPSPPSVAPLLTQIAQLLIHRKLQPIYGRNIARAYCRLSSLDPAHSKLILLKQTSLLDTLSTLIRSQEPNELTSFSLRTITHVLCRMQRDEIPGIINGIAAFMECTIGYLSHAQEEELAKEFSHLAKILKAAVGEAGFHSILNRPIFLPAMRNKINQYAL